MLTLETLQDVENVLDQRIAILSETNARYKRIIAHLRFCQAEEKSTPYVHSDKDDDQISPPLQEETSDTTKLDDILSLARKIRESKKNAKDDAGANHNPQPESSTSRMKPRSKRGANRSCISSPSPSLESVKGSRSDVTTESQNLRVPGMKENNELHRISLRQNLLSQLDMISKNRLMWPLAANLSHDLITSQTQLLTRLSGRPRLPKTFIYDTVQFKVESSVRKALRNRPLDVTVLAQSIKDQRHEYERYIKGPLSRRSLTAQERERLLTSYCKINRLYKCYERLEETDGVAAVSKSGDEISLAVESNDELLDMIPLCTPLERIPAETRTTTPEQRRQAWQHWYDESRSRAKHFHKHLENTVKVISESSIATHGLRDTVRQLKECCEASITPRSSTGAVAVGGRSKKWIPVLKQYRGLRNCLVDEARGATSIMFTEKYGYEVVNSTTDS
jgi:hypothetical protein